MRNFGFISRVASTVALVALLISTFGCSGFSSGRTNSAPTANTYAYVAQLDRSTSAWSIAQFQVASDGTFTALNPQSFAMDASGYSLTADPSGNYVFAEGGQIGQTTGTIYQFTMGSDGTLANNSVPRLTTSNYPGGIVFTPDGRFAIGPSGDSLVSSYALSSTGTLSLVNTVLAGFGPTSVAIDATGQFAYVTAGTLGSGGEFTLSEYSISRSGTLNLVVTYPIWLNPVGLVVSPKGMLYLSEYTPSTMGGLPGAIVVFSINEVTGGLSVMQTYTTADSDPGTVLFDPTGTYAYVGNGASQTISQFTVDPGTGALTQNGPDAVTGYIGPGSSAVDPSGKFIYCANQGQNNTFSPQVSLLAINPDGTVTPSGTSISLDTNEYPSAIVIARH